MGWPAISMCAGGHQRQRRRQAGDHGGHRATAGKYFGVSPELWLELQSDYDVWVLRRSTWPEIARKIRVRAA
jgi:hypothetical protein